MKKVLFALLILAVLALSISASFADSSINNATDLNGAINQARGENKSVMIFFDQENCYYCDLFKDNVLSNGDVISELNRKCVLVVIDVNKHPEIASKFKVFGTPTVVFLDSNQKEIERIDGYVSANEFLNIVKGI